jgi:hypothetical protein
MPALATYELTKDYAVGFGGNVSSRARLADLSVEPERHRPRPMARKTTTLKLLMQLVFLVRPR